tara:strand:- start:1258 stop:1725 length:468 start_codon:yes stop_codon:yes gene_type:complete
MIKLGYATLLLLSITFFLSSFLIWASVGLKWMKFREFFHKSYTYIDICFILAYFFEQYFLVIILSTTIFDARVVAGIFALLMITTASLQAKALQSRIDLISQEVTGQRKIISSLNQKNNDLTKTISKVRNQLKKSKEEIINILELLKEEVSKKKG